MLILNEKDIVAAAGRAELMDRIEEIFRIHEAGDFLMPFRYHLDYGPNTLLLMPCFMPDQFGTKLLTLFPGNAERGKPVIQALMVLNDAETGEVAALLNGQVLTALRTGAVGGVAVRHFSPKTPHGLGLIGAGVQGFQQVRFAEATGRISHVTVYDADAEKVPAFIHRLSQILPDMPIEAAGTVEALLERSRTVITATPATEPVLPDDADSLRGKHFIGIGSYKPSMREYPESLFRLLRRLYVDTEHAIEESGDLTVPLERGWIDCDRVMTMGKFLAEKERTEAPLAETTLFKSVGMALYDVGVSQLLYRRALEMGLGQKVEL